MQSDIDPVTDTYVKKKKKKDKKAKKSEENHSCQNDVGDKHKTGKRKVDDLDITEDSGICDNLDAEDHSKNKKVKKHRSLDSIETNIEKSKKAKKKKEKDLGIKNRDIVKDISTIREKKRGEKHKDKNVEDIIDPGEADPDEDPEKAAIRAKKREKRRQKKIAQLKLKQEREARAGTGKASALVYLKQWDTDRKAWKFMKVRQVWCLHNMFDSDQMNDEHFEILVRYIKHLQGVSRKTTVENAEKIIKEAEEDTTDDSEFETKADRARQVIQMLSD